MDYYAGIDVSLELSSVCVVDANGKILREAKVARRMCAHGKSRAHGSGVAAQFSSFLVRNWPQEKGEAKSRIG